MAKLRVYTIDGNKDYFNCGYSFDERKSPAMKIWYGKDKGSKGAKPSKTFELNELRKKDGKYFRAVKDSENL